MQLPSNLVAFWQRLTRIQRLSLVSILFFLVVLSVGIWLALSPTSPFSRASEELTIPPIPEINPPPIPPPPPPVPGFPTGSIEGPGSGIAGEEIGPFMASGSGSNLSWVRIHWALSTDDLGIKESWSEPMAANDNCRGISPCTTSGSFRPSEPGDYVVAVNVNNQQDSEVGNENFPCSGNPAVEGVTDPDISPVPGWVDCGPKSRTTVRVTAEQTFLLRRGYNFVGVNFSKDQYKSEDFLRDLNASFKRDDIATIHTANLAESVKYVFRYDITNRSWQSHVLGKTTDDNFLIEPWEGYLVYAPQSGSSIISIEDASSSLIPVNFTLNTGWSLVSTPIALPRPYNSAKALLELAQTQGIDVTSIWRWDPTTKQYQGYRKTTGGTDFPIVEGEAYWFYNNGKTGNLVYPIPLPPIPQ